MCYYTKKEVLKERWRRNSESLEMYIKAMHELEHYLKTGEPQECEQEKDLEERRGQLLKQMYF